MDLYIHTPIMSQAFFTVKATSSYLITLRPLSIPLLSPQMSSESCLHLLCVTFTKEINFLSVLRARQFKKVVEVCVF